MLARPRRLLAGLLLVGALFAVSVPMDAASAAPRAISDDQEEVRDLVNNTRDNNNLRGLAMHQQFADKALLWSRELARCQCLKHRTGAYGAPAGWCAAAENVGRGWSLAQVHRAFLGSPPHKANMLTRRFTHIGTGVTQDAGGEYFVVQAYADLSC